MVGSYEVEGGMVESFGLEVSRSRPDWMMGEGLLLDFWVFVSDLEVKSAALGLLLTAASLVLKSL